MNKSNKQKFVLITGLIFIVFICIFATTRYIETKSSQGAKITKQEQVTDACAVADSNEALFVGCNGFF